MSDKTVRIGGGSGFWGDSAEGPRQLVTSGGIEYLALDYLAEVTMSIMARARAKNPDLGYAVDFVTEVIRPLAGEISSRGIKVVCNAGGVNPLACRAAVEAELARQGVKMKVAAVIGDDAAPFLPSLRAQGVKEMATGAPIPETMLTANAYLGAFPIARALAEGADIVITGRCADSALALGPLIHEFGWKPTDLDALAGGTLAGHVIECGPLSTGGYFTDWRDVAATWASIGYPIAECRSDGSFLITKPRNTGGMVTVGTVSEQIAYETGDPANYILPDVVCDMTSVCVRQVAEDLVEVTGIKGKPATPYYKVSGTWQDGFRCLGTLLIRGREAVPKARAVGEAILKRASAILEREGLGPYDETSIELLGAEEAFEDAPATDSRREVMLKVAARHKTARGVDVLSREMSPASTGTVQGVGGVFGGRPKVQPMVRLFSFLTAKELLKPQVHIDDRTIDVPAGSNSLPSQGQVASATPKPAAQPNRSESVDAPAGPRASVPLQALAFSRSGDKGDISNVAVIARRPEFVPELRRQLTEERVAQIAANLVKGRVERFEWPGLPGFNFLLHDALGGGGVASLRYDPQGKAHSQFLLDCSIDIPQAWIEKGWVKAQ